MATRKKNLKEKVLNMIPEMVKGSHLTTWTYPDGTTKLEWDDEALLRDVRDAILKAESTVPLSETKSKRTRKAKE
jgi:hypothetical protein